MDRTGWETDVAVDMMTVVIVGSSRSRTLRHAGATRVLTPRGYAARRQAGMGEGA